MASKLRAELWLGVVSAACMLLGAGCGSRTGLLSAVVSVGDDDDVVAGGSVATGQGGGPAMGGIATGGKASGGVATGGKASGGVATAGVATGGVAMGGVATGGVATGGEAGALPMGGEGGAASCEACLVGCQDGKCLKFPVLLSAGQETTCAAINGGPIRCWGSNLGRQLDQDSQLQPTTSVEVTELGTGARSVAVGNGDVCAVTAGGAVKCWGVHYSDGAQNVAPLSSGILAVAAGAPYFDHTCALTEAGGVKCWGANNFGQLGNGTTSEAFTYSYTVVDVLGLSSGVVRISAGSNNTCALTAGGGLKCWGMNWYGALGDGMLDQPAGPVDVVGLSSGVSRVASGELSSCVVMVSGGVKCWGWGTLVPTDVVGLSSGMTAVALSGSACALTKAGGVKCWGANGAGQLGNGTLIDSQKPVDVVGLTHGAVAVAVGQYHACAVLETGAVKCWGHNQIYQLGNGTKTQSTVPVDVVGF